MPLVTTTPFGAIPEEYGLLFNGTDQYGFHDIAFPSSVAAMSIWIIPTITYNTTSARGRMISTGLTPPTKNLILGPYTGASGAETLGINNDTGGPQVRTLVENYTFTAGSTFHIVINWNGSNYEVTINNVAQTVTFGSSTGHVGIWAGNLLTVANDRLLSTGMPDGLNYFSGSMSNLQFFDTALTGGEITALFNGGKNGPTGTTGKEMAIYKFDEGMGAVAGDSSGGSPTRDLTLVNNPTWL